MKNSYQFNKYSVVKSCNLNSILKYIIYHRKYCDWKHRGLIAYGKNHQHCSKIKKCQTILIRNDYKNKLSTYYVFCCVI